MLKALRDKIALSGITVLLIGVALLIFTFISAYGFLTQSISIIASQDLVQTFGEALAPLIATCIRIMYLGVMGWIGSLLTIRGVTIIAQTPKIPKVELQKRKIIKQLPQKTKTELTKKDTRPAEAKVEKPRDEAQRPEEAQPQEPEILVIPPEQNPQIQSQHEQKQEQNTSQQPSSH